MNLPQLTQDNILIQKIQQLAPQRKAEVADFVDFLRNRDERQAAADRITANLAKLDALNLPPLSDEEINEEIAAVRATRRAKQGGAS
jgi:DNA repair ATPase RecN